MTVKQMNEKFNELCNRYYEMKDRYGESDVLTRIAKERYEKYSNCIDALEENGIITLKQWSKIRKLNY